MARKRSFSIVENIPVCVMHRRYKAAIKSGEIPSDYTFKEYVALEQSLLDMAADWGCDTWGNLTDDYSYLDD